VGQRTNECARCQPAAHFHCLLLLPQTNARPHSQSGRADTKQPLPASACLLPACFYPPAALPQLVRRPLSPRAALCRDLARFAQSLVSAGPCPRVHVPAASCQPPTCCSFHRLPLASQTPVFVSGWLVNAPPPSTHAQRPVQRHSCHCSHSFTAQEKDRRPSGEVAKWRAGGQRAASQWTRHVPAARKSGPKSASNKWPPIGRAAAESNRRAAVR